MFVSRRVSGHRTLNSMLKCLLVLGLVQGSIASTTEEYPEYIAKTYSGEWTMNSAKFSRGSNQTIKSYYYDTIEMTVAAKGLYTFTSTSSVSTYGCIYNNSFDPLNPELNLISKADGNNRKMQFKLLETLQSDQKYVLLVTTSNPSVTGQFSIVLFGPAAINILPRVETKQFDFRQDVTTRAPITSSFSAELTSSSPLFHRPDDDDDHHFFYYYALRVFGIAQGEYTFQSRSVSDMDTYGYLYRDSFDPARPSVNLITEDDDDGMSFQFQLKAYLSPGRFYILVVTTHPDCEIGNFTIDASGPSAVRYTPTVPRPSQPITGSCAIMPDLQSTYTGTLSASSDRFNKPDGDPNEMYYYQAVQIMTSVAGTYVIRSESDVDMDTVGLLYSPSFDPSRPQANLIFEDDDGSDDIFQFEIREVLRPGFTYILVVTTHQELTTGSFSVLIHGPGSINISPIRPSTSQPIPTPTTPMPPIIAYSGSFSSSSSAYIRPDGDDDSAYYFQALQVAVTTSGTYMFTSSSVLDTLGYLYNVSFDPSIPTSNLIMEDDDDGDAELQFRIQVYLTANQTYILVVTTHREYQTGSFSILARGPEIPTLTSISTFTTQAIPLQSTSPTMSTTYSGTLTYTSSIFYRPEGEVNRFYYYQALRVTVTKLGQYVIMSQSGLDTFGYLYTDSFDPSNPIENLDDEDDDDGIGVLQFRIQAYLHPGRTYILVVTTHRPFDTGRYTVRVTGSASASVSSYWPSTSQPITTTLPPSLQILSYPGALTTSSQIFYRPDSFSTHYYYFQAYRISVNTSGFYTFISNSSIDTRGYIYAYSFDPSNPLTNLLMDNDDGGSNRQFRLLIHLYTFRSYILVVSTHREFDTGSFTVIASGVGQAVLTETTPATSQPITTQATTPSIPTTLPGVLSANSQIFYRPGGSNRDYYYFQAFQVAASMAGRYRLTSVSTIDTRGYLYEASFDPSTPSLNLLDDNDDGGTGQQFLIEFFLQAGQTYVIVVTTHREYVQGNFSILVTGPSTLILTSITPSTVMPITRPPVTQTIPTDYIGELSITSQSYVRPNSFTTGTYYYQAIEAIPNIAGMYTFRSASGVDTRGYLYETYFDAQNTTNNLLADNDDGDGYPNFRISIYLQAQQIYALVVTTHAASVTGKFSVLVTGPALLRLTSIRPTTQPPPTTTTTIAETASTYVNALLRTSPAFSRPNGIGQGYYYQAVEITTNTSGPYTIKSQAYFDAVGYLYNEFFNPIDPTINQMAFNDNCGTTSDFCIPINLQAGNKYVVIITSAQQYVTGLYWLRVAGPVLAKLVPIVPQPATNAPMTPPATPPKAFASINTCPTFTLILATLILSMLQILRR